MVNPNFETRLCANLSLHAGGGWLGHVFFLVAHPITGIEGRFNSLVEVEQFCRNHNLHLDRTTLVSEIFPKLSYDPKYGWTVPLDKIDKNRPVSTANHYLSELNNVLF